MTAVRQALTAIGIDSPRPANGGDPDVVVRSPDGSSVAIEVKAAAVPTPDWVAKLRPTDGRHIVVVADHIPTGVREELNDRGIAWLDRRGHLRLVGGGFFIDTDVPAAERSQPSTSSRPAISGRSGLAAAAALLMRPDDPTGVGEVARATGMNASSISRAMATLADAQLADRLNRGRYRPLAPELFWALADVWPGARTAIPLSIADLTDPRLGTHVDDLDAVGWAIGGEGGAVAWGAPLVLTGDYPTLMFVPSDESIRVARAIGTPATSTSGSRSGSRTRSTSGSRSGLREGTARGRPSAIEVSVDPIGLVTRSRYPARSATAPLAHPVFCALDLAATSRGRESLDQWDPPEGFVRVW